MAGAGINEIPSKLWGKKVSNKMSKEMKGILSSVEANQNNYVSVKFTKDWTKFQTFVQLMFCICLFPSLIAGIDLSHSTIYLLKDGQVENWVYCFSLKIAIHS